jgi:hypothetical protein
VGVVWIQLTQDRDRWRAAVSAVMDLRVLAPRCYIYIYIASNEKVIMDDELERIRKAAIMA